jgi:hypothetical protein
MWITDESIPSYGTRSNTHIIVSAYSTAMMLVEGEAITSVFTETVAAERRVLVNYRKSWWRSLGTPPERGAADVFSKCNAHARSAPHSRRLALDSEVNVGVAPPTFVVIELLTLFSRGQIGPVLDEDIGVGGVCRCVPEHELTADRFLVTGCAEDHEAERLGFENTPDSQREHTRFTQLNPLAALGTHTGASATLRGLRRAAPAPVRGTAKAFSWCLRSVRPEV